MKQMKMMWIAALVLACSRVLAFDSALAPVSGSAGAAGGMQNVAQELDADYGYVGGATTHGAHSNFGAVSEQSSHLKYVLSPEITKDFLLRFGVEWERFSFGLSKEAPLPNTLQQVSAIIGLDYQINDQWLMRVECSPGVYSDFADVGSRDFDLPVVMGWSYLVDADLQWFFGVRVDMHSKYPVIPAPGVRWKFADDWTLMGVFPSPRVEHDLNDQLKAYVGLDFKAGSYRMGRHFGDDHDQPTLNSALMDYMEVRMGPGLSWKVLPNVTLDVEGGYMLYREFDFYDKATVLRSRPAPYAGLACHARF